MLNLQSGKEIIWQSTYKGIIIPSVAVRAKISRSNSQGPVDYTKNFEKCFTKYQYHIDDLVKNIKKRFNSTTYKISNSIELLLNFNRLVFPRSDALVSDPYSSVNNFKAIVKDIPFVPNSEDEVFKLFF